MKSCVGYRVPNEWASVCSYTWHWVGKHAAYFTLRNSFNHKDSVGCRFCTFWPQRLNIPYIDFFPY